jgi:ribose transport system substrate-binding protein
MKNRLFVLFVCFFIISSVIAFAGGGKTETKPSGYVIGISNTVVGNGWRDEMVCSIIVQARKSGLVSKVVNAQRNGGATEQIQDMRSLISAGVDAIIVNPADREALNAVIAEAAAEGIVTVAVDQAVTAPEAYIVTNDQVAYGRISAEWVFKQLKGEGTVVEIRGAAGSPADTDRHQGFEEARAAYPNIKVITVWGNWSIATISQEITQLLASGARIDGITTPGAASVVWDAFDAAERAHVPLAVADLNGDIGPLFQRKNDGITGIAVSNPAVVGAAGVTVALNVLEGKKQDKVTLLTPESWDSTTPEGLEKIKEHYDDRLGPFYSTIVEIPGYTDFTPGELLECKGPSE